MFSFTPVKFRISRSKILTFRKWNQQQIKWVGKNAFSESSGQGFKEKIAACIKLKSLGLSVCLVQSCAGVLSSVSDSDLFYSPLKCILKNVGGLLWKWYLA